MTPAGEIQLVAVATAAACALLGVFLVLRRMTMLTDAISHAILPGIVIAYLFGGSVASPWLLLGAALAGVATVWLVELVFQSGNLREDAAIGIVFPALFAIGVILVTRYAGDVHLDVDAVLMGELAFVPFDRIMWNGFDVGPRALWRVLAVLVLNVLVVAALYKELKISAFDQPLAAVMGLSPLAVHYILMSSVSLTAVAAFDAVGSILVVALFAGPPATAYLFSNRVSTLLWLAPLLGGGSAIAGYWLARAYDVSIAGTMVSVVGVVFAAAVLTSPRHGLFVAMLRRRAKRQASRMNMLLVHLLHHEPETGDAESSLATLFQHLSWSEDDVAAAVAAMTSLGLVERSGGHLILTFTGRSAAAQVMATAQALPLSPAAL